MRRNNKTQIQRRKEEIGQSRAKSGGFLRLYGMQSIGSIKQRHEATQVKPLEKQDTSSMGASPGIKLSGWLRRKIVDPFLLVLPRGLEPNQLAFSSALGVTLGVFPICGVTVFLCGIAIALLGSRCHSPSVMLFNFVVTPLELSLVVPFLRFGEAITGGPRFPFTSDALKKVLTGQESREVLLSILHALLGWFVAAPLIFVVLYVLFLPCYKVLVSKFRSRPSSPSKSPLSPKDINIKIRDV